jgi:hypothetical protein
MVVQGAQIIENLLLAIVRCQLTIDKARSRKLRVAVKKIGLFMKTVLMCKSSFSCERKSATAAGQVDRCLSSSGHQLD